MSEAIQSVVLRAYPNAAVYLRHRAGRPRYVVVREYPRSDRVRLSLIGSWCRSAKSAWESAYLRLVENRPGPGGCGVRA